MTEALIRVQIEELSEGVFLATSEDLPGLVAQGRTVAETLEIAQDVARRLVESYLEHGDGLPSTVKGVEDGRVELRIPVSIG
jgi:predicted RNase H-like HicB family nuclease